MYQNHIRPEGVWSQEVEKDLTQAQIGYEGLLPEPAISNQGQSKKILQVGKVTFEDVTRSSSLKHIWEIDNGLKCPVIGASLSVEEHRKVLNKAGYPTKRKSPYRLHQAIMIHLDSENRISVKVDNYLRHKYRNEILTLKNMNEETFMDNWRECLDAGKISAAFYVATARKDITATALDEIFGDVHMINHANLHAVNQSRRQLSMQMDANQKLSKLLKQQKEKTNRIKKEMPVLKTSLREACRLNEQLKRSAKSCDMQNEETVGLQIQNRKLRQAVRHSDRQIKELSGQRDCIERQKKRLEIKVFDLQATNRKLNDELKQFIAQFSSYVECEGPCDEKCPKLRLCARRVLVVGGRIRMRHLYRDLVESSGGQFEYHDGYMQSGQQNLEDRVKRCDLIICPVNCNSHGACNSVKKFCLKYSKPFRMLSSSSLSAVSNAMFENFEGRS
jgi:hypothetical protein